jgi:hypothetical protein
LKPTSKKKKNQKPFWERAYQGHAYWLGKTKLGKVRLAGRKQYRWEAAGRVGETEELEAAKRAVEMAILMADKQLDLFEAPK